MSHHDRPKIPEIETVPVSLRPYVFGMESYVSYLEGYIKGLLEYVKELKGEYERD